MGVVDSFSLKNAFASGLTAGATAGMGGYVKGMEWAQAAGDASKFGHMGKMAMAAAASGTNWAANKLAGNNQVSFSWRSVVTSTVSAGAGSLLGFSDQSSMFSRFNEGGGLLNGTLDGIAGAAINYGVGKGLYNQGGWDFGKVATDAFGNALANTAISGAIKGGRAATDKAKMDKMFDATSRKINAKLDAQQHETQVTQQQRITGELGNNVDALLSSGTARLESENEASLGRYQHARLNLAESANVSSAAYAADAVALTLRHNSQMQNLRAGANAALAAGMVHGESMHAAGLRNRAPVGPVLITSEQANGYINFMQAQQTQHQQYYASLNGGQKFLYNGGANLFGGLLKGGQAIGDATALFGIQGGNKFNHAWSGVGDGLQYIAQHPVDALVINPAVAAYGHYSSIYAADGLGAMAGTMVGDVLTGSVFAMLGGGSAIGTAGRVGKVVPNKVDDIFRIIPESEYLAIKGRSVHNVDSNTLVLGKYTPTIKSGVKDWSVPGPDSYVAIARTEKATYFDLGSEWGSVTSKYNVSDPEMFKAFNIPVLDDAVSAGKQIKFTHDPRTNGGFLQQEWEYLQNTHGFKRLKEADGVWYAK